jgi:hypothetical protein
MENQQLFSPSRKCSCTPVGFSQGFFLAESNVATLDHPPFSPDLATADFLPVSSNEINTERKAFL